MKDSIQVQLLTLLERLLNQQELQLARQLVFHMMLQ
jgi:hypothetical protein